VKNLSLSYAKYSSGGHVFKKVTGWIHWLTDFLNNLESEISDVLSDIVEHLQDLQVTVFSTCCRYSVVMKPV
jgi:hypothetical protein